MYKGESKIPAGVPVSLDFDGYVQRGAGFGVYRGVSVDSLSDEMVNLKTETIDNGNLLVAAYDGNLRAYDLSSSNFKFFDVSFFAIVLLGRRPFLPWIMIPLLLTT